MKKICAVVLAAVLLFSLLLPALAEEEGDSVLRGFNGTYQYVLLGNYPWDSEGIVMGNDPYGSKDVEMRPVLWRILSREEGTLLLITEYVIELQQVTFVNDPDKIKHYDYPVLERFADSDLCHWMNTDMFDHLFGQDPLVNAMLNETDKLGDRGRLFCLTDVQFCQSSYGFRANKKPTGLRVAAPTPYALNRRIFRDGKKKNINYKEGGSPYWCSTQTAPYRFQIVGYDGHLSAGAFSRENIGLRPSIRLDETMVGVESGKGTKKDPFILKYTGPFPAVAPEEEAEPADTETAEPEADSEAEEEPAETAEPEPEDTPEEEPKEAAEEEPEETEEAAEEETEPAVIPGPGEEAGKNAAADTEAEEEPEEETPEEEEEAPEEEEEPEGETLPEAGASKEGTAVISFLGDCSIGDALQSVTKANSYHSVVDREGYGWPFSEVQKYIGTDDMTVGNLEVVITTQTKHKNIVFPLRADPDHVNILLESSIDVVNTANNHCYDFHRNGYVDTLQALDDAGIDHFGSVYYSRKDGFDDVTVKDVNGIRIGLFGFTYPTENDLKHAEVLIQKLREEEHCDYIIASLHWGRETHLVPGTGNVKYAQKLLNLGADMIYGHHPHVLQPVAFYNNKPVLFSTGNATFGTLSSNMDQHAAIFQLTLEKKASGTVPRKLEAIPCKYYKTGDYRIEEETDEEQRAKTYKILSPGRKLVDCVNPPESFLSTGVVQFDEAGEMTADP